MSLKKVVIYQRVVPSYRIPFFDELYDVLSQKGVELTVVCGNENPNNNRLLEEINRPWAIQRKVRYLNLFGTEIVFQAIRLSDLKFGSTVIVEQANRLVVNYVFYVLKALGVIKLGLWGHGKNFQSSDGNNLKEKFKRIYSKLPNRWFCYTESGRALMVDNGYPKKQITVVYNSVDVKNLLIEKDRLSETELSDLKSELALDGDNVAIYCGGMYAEKRIGFLLDACLKIKQDVEDFQVIFIGIGPESYLVEEFCLKNDWAHYVGEVYGVERVKYFCISSVMLMPGLVGLAVLDSIALQVPMVTTDIKLHSPEIEYLSSGFNGLIVEDDLHTYAQSIVDLLKDRDKLNNLKKGCMDVSYQYSIEMMANNFAEGVVKLLEIK
ncbi:MAG: glycosyltransferase family 4 protein [Paraglaciecola sp.]|uniref:glycosyltransferase family 4 protein n=1 Tax=Paraglaciecola sp. TaxID=1920173 RepID=UPI003296CC57